MNATYQYYVLNPDQQQLGPYTEAELRNRVTSGSLPYDAYIWREGLTEWTTVAECFPPPSREILSPPITTSPPRLSHFTARAKPTVSYPRWFRALFVVFFIAWLYSSGWRTWIRNEQAVHINEYIRRGGGGQSVIPKVIADYSDGRRVWRQNPDYIPQNLIRTHSGFESVQAFCGELLSDPFGKTNTNGHDQDTAEVDGDLHQQYAAASLGKGFSFALALLSAFLWGVKAFGYRRSIKDGLGPEP